MALIRNSVAHSIARDAIVMDLADVHKQADLIVEHAMKKAQALVTESEAERKRQITGAAQLGQKDGHAKGLAEGRQTGISQGRDEALRESRQKLDELQQAWNAALTDFQSRREDLLLDARTTVLQLAICIAKKVIKREVELDPSVVVDQLGSVLDLVVLPSRLVVSINPEDRALVEGALPKLSLS
jgi:flagellar biosynthesis/type III secretory pathway protein FliH